MTSNMLACYPEVFAGGAIVAGLPYGAARPSSKLSKACIKVPPARRMERGDACTQGLASPRAVATRLGLAWMQTRQ